MRYTFGFTGDGLINGAVAEDAIRTSSAELDDFIKTTYKTKLRNHTSLKEHLISN